MEGCLLIGGKAPDKEILAPLFRKWDIVLAADSGLAHARKLGLTPTDLVGDLDSVDPALIERYPGLRIHRHAQDKDETDTELGIDLLRTMGSTSVHVIGGGGGRLDHLYALLSLFHRESPPDHWYTHREHVALITVRSRYSLPPGKRVSFFPVGSLPVRMHSRGLKWPLDSLEWSVGKYGISNITIAEEIEIEMVQGRLIMMYDLGSEDRS